MLRAPCARGAEQKLSWGPISVGPTAQTGPQCRHRSPQTWARGPACSVSDPARSAQIGAGFRRNRRLNQAISGGQAQLSDRQLRRRSRVLSRHPRPRRLLGCSPRRLPCGTGGLRGCGGWGTVPRVLQGARRPGRPPARTHPCSDQVTETQKDRAQTLPPSPLDHRLLSPCGIVGTCGLSVVSGKGTMPHAMSAQ